MLVDIIEAKALPQHHLFLRFKDGTEGTVDISKHVEFTGVFEGFKDEKYFKSVKVTLGTVSWPNGADLDPDVLYALVKGLPRPDLSKTSSDDR